MGRVKKGTIYYLAKQSGFNKKESHSTLSLRSPVFLSFDTYEVARAKVTTTSPDGNMRFSSLFPIRPINKTLFNDDDDIVFILWIKKSKLAYFTQLSVFS